MRVFCLIDSLAPGGAETSLAALAPHLVRKGIGLEVAYLKDSPGLQGHLEEAGAELIDLSDGGGRPGWMRDAHRAIAQRRPDLVHTTLFESDMAGRVGAWTARVPVVSSLVNVEYGPEQFSDPDLPAIRLRAAQLVDAVTARSVVRWHAITHHVADVMARRIRIRRELIDVVPRGRDPERLGRRTPERGQRTRRLLGLDPDAKLIVAAARHEHQKGLDTLLEAMPQIAARCPSARLVIAGRAGNQTPLLNQLRAQLGIESLVQMLGPRDDVADLLAAADVFAFPSRFEGLGSVLLEAMGLEAPIVASRLPPVVETIYPGVHALVVAPEQPAGLAEAVIAAVSRPDEARTRAIAARRRFLEHYTIEAVADEMIRFYERAARRPSRVSASASRG